MGITIEIYVGNESSSYINMVSKLRIDVFREYPYLYEGEEEYERKYIHGYTTDKRAMIAIAKVDNVVAGISTGIPLISESDIVADAKKVFSQANINIGDYYYYGEVIILPQFRGLGIAKMLFSAQDTLIEKWGFKQVCILTVVREHNHPLKPINYKSPDGMWEHLGFFRNKITTNYHWPTIQADNTVRDVTNTLEFWTKHLKASNAVIEQPSDNENTTERIINY